MAMSPYDQLRCVLLAKDREDAKKESHAYQVWEDGEVTIQKAGDLLWQRTLHTAHLGWKGLDLNLPHKMGEHSFIWLHTDDAADVIELVTRLVPMAVPDPDKRVLPF